MAACSIIVVFMCVTLDYSFVFSLLNNNSRGRGCVLPTLTPSFPYQSLSVRVGLLVQNELGHLVVTTVGGDVQCRQVVVGDVVHRHVVLEQQLDAVQVVSLSGHVERRQAVLRGEERGKDRERETERGKTKRERQTHTQTDT